MSTFSGLSTAYTGLVAARKGMEVVGQNIANANTDGYTRQRVTTSAAGPVATTGMFTGGAPRVGQGVSIDGVARLGNAQLDTRVRISAAISGYSAVRANALFALEGTLHEPGENGLSAQLQNFWSGWQAVSNRPGEPASAGVLLQEANALTTQISSGYREVEGQWTQLRSDAAGMTAELNDAAKQVADLNKQIRSTIAAGGSVNELLDARGRLTTTIAAISGGTVREQPDGTVDVLIGGNAIVSGSTFRAVAVTGANNLATLNGGGPDVRLVWAHSPDESVALDGGELAGALSMLGRANTSGTGGAIAEAAASYNDFATNLADQVNEIYSENGSKSNFFNFDAANAAQSLSVVVTNPADLRAGTFGKDNSIADAISQLGVDPDGPNTTWSNFVTKIGVATKAEMQQATLADVAATSASNMQFASASVDLDEENVNLLMYQHAYQGAARVLTAIDEMLDTLINRTGLVGR